MRKNMQSILLFMVMLAGMLASGCATKQAPVQEMPEWAFHDIVDAAFVAQYAKLPKPEGVMIIDSRPYQAKYVKGYIPRAVSMPYTKFDKMPDRLPADKNALLVFYCGGLHCKLSHKSAAKAEKLGYTNVKVFAEGYPAWKKAGGDVAIGIEQVKAMVDAGDPYMLVDARPYKKFLAGHIPSSVSIPDTGFEAKAGLLPADKSLPLVFYCGGYKCKLSHKSAAKARALGYTNTMIAEAGYPAWKELYGGSAAVEVKGGTEEGSIDPAQFKKILAENPESIMLVDVRDADEFQAGHIPSAVNIPVDQLEKRIGELPADKPVVFVCTTGARSGEAFYMVMDLRPELKDVYYLEAETDFHSDGTFEVHLPK